MAKRTANGHRPRVLIGDVGGTHTRLAIHEIGRAAPIATLDADSPEHASLDAIAAPFVRGAGVALAGAAIGVAGPVRDGSAVITNLPWRLDERDLARKLRAPKLLLLNDLVVAARGCLGLPAKHLVTLTAAAPSPKGQHLGVIAAGTGLGEARLVWTGERHLALATEGSHCDFAPRSPLELELWHFMRARHPDHVSYERVVSGAGLGAIYDFFAARSGRESATVKRRLAYGDRNAAIAELGLARGSRTAARAVDLFVSIWGSEAGNLALRELALGGIYVVGNIGTHLVPARRDLFLEGFRAKGRFAALLAEVPVAVVTHKRVALRGALAFARDLVAS